MFSGNFQTFHRRDCFLNLGQYRAGLDRSSYQATLSECVIVQVQTGNLSLKIVQYCIYIIVFALVKALERVQKLRCNDKIFILAINTLSSVCSMLITATFYVMGIDLNTLKTSHDSLISIAVILKTYNICSKRIREFHMQACQPITAEAGYTQQTCPLKQSVWAQG